MYETCKCNFPKNKEMKARTICFPVNGVKKS